MGNSQLGERGGLQVREEKDNNSGARRQERNKEKKKQGKFRAFIKPPLVGKRWKKKQKKEYGKDSRRTLVDTHLHCSERYQGGRPDLGGRKDCLNHASQKKKSGSPARALGKKEKRPS